MLVTILGEPIAQQRHRTCRRGGHVMQYDPLAEEKRKKKAVLSLTKFEVANKYEVSFKFYFEVPKSATKSNKNEKLWGIEKENINKDLDNLEKFYLDCMSGIAFTDDKQVVKLSSEKFYSLCPRTEIEIKAKPMAESEVKKILSLVSPYDFNELAKICFDIYALREELSTVLVSEKEKQEKVAKILCKLATQTAAYLPQIHKKFPDYHLKNEEVPCQ